MMPAHEYYEFKDEKSSKFWQFEIDAEHQLSITYGKIGAKGRVQLKAFSSADEALKQAKKSAAAKVKKGYVLLTDKSSTVNSADEELASATTKNQASVESPSKAPSSTAAAKTQASKKSIAQELAPEVLALDELLISPDLNNRELGLTMLENGQPEKHLAALLMLANGLNFQNEYMIDKEELSQRTEIAKKAKALLKTLPKLPKEAFSYYGFAPAPSIEPRKPILWLISANGISPESAEYAKLPGRKVKMNDSRIT